MLNATDSFLDNSSPFSPEDAGAGGSVSGGSESSTPGVIPPFAKRLTNSANLEFSWQTGPNVMIGVSGLETELHYPNPAQTPGLYDSNSRGGSFFYNRRISRTKYFGANYQYLDMLANPGNRNRYDTAYRPFRGFSLSNQRRGFRFRYPAAHNTIRPSRRRCRKWARGDQSVTA